MEHPRVLIVSDSSDRRNFLEYHVRSHKMSPICYPNIMAARKAVRSDPFFMVVVDLSIPIEPKLALVKETCRQQPEARVITLEKEEYLKKTGVFLGFSSVDSIDSIKSFPDKLVECGGKVG